LTKSLADKEASMFEKTKQVSALGRQERFQSVN